jgi:uncharacterized radical SAM protein YgiQ
LAELNDKFPPLTARAMRRRGWDEVDVVLVSGDAYVDHPSFAAAMIARALESAGFRVGVIAQPDWRSAEAFREFGKPRLFWAVSGGNLDSMLGRFTASRKVRNDDPYSPGGEAGRRPERAVTVYSQRCREAFGGVPVVIGGIEASLRRFAHFDYWSNSVRRSVLLDSKADLLVFGMGERAVIEIARRLGRGESIRALRDMPSTAYLLGAKETPPTSAIMLPSYEEARDDRRLFAEMTRLIHQESLPGQERPLTQAHERRYVVVNPAATPASADELDRYYDLPFQRVPHPDYGGVEIPAHTMIRDSVTIMRGCFGGCAFCGLGLHQGKVVQSRSRRSILDELERVVATAGFKGTISDLGGPSANMYAMTCGRAQGARGCPRPSCLWPTLCANLKIDHRPLIDLMRASRRIPGIKRVLIASGVRMDLATQDHAYIDELAAHHTGGHLKVAPEHISAATLEAMRKPALECYEAFERCFQHASDKAGKEQYLVPYFIAGHPGCTVDDMVELARFLARRHLRPQQVQDFIPLPGTIAGCMYHTGIDPMTGRSIHVPKSEQERATHRALLQYWKPEHRAIVVRFIPEIKNSRGNSKPQ